jgi:YidC/Oxa1 family membrane protein insertase
MAFFANLFGYLLNFIYNIVGNYGWAIIIFSIVVKALMIPLAIKQQKTMKKNAKMQVKMKEIQFKYKNDPERLNQATMQLYKDENISPLSGCFSLIIQLVLLLAVFYLVRSPLTHMKKVDTSLIDKYYTIMKEENIETNGSYPQIEIIREVGTLRNIENEKINQEELDKLSVNMEFLGLDLSQIPSKNTSNWKVFIIPVLYVIISFISMKISLKTQAGGKKKEKLLNGDNRNPEQNPDDMMEAVEKANQNMSMMFPVMYLAVALIAPLGLALYWLVNSVLMIIERLVLTKIIKDDE